MPLLTRKSGFGNSPFSISSFNAGVSGLSAFNRAAPGSLWVDGAFLYFTGSEGATCRAEGANLGTIPDAKPGSLWVEGESLMYVDIMRRKRELISPHSSLGGSSFGTSKFSLAAFNSGVGGSSPISNAVPGSLWVEGNDLCFISASHKKLNIFSSIVLIVEGFAWISKGMMINIAREV